MNEITCYTSRRLAQAYEFYYVSDPRDMALAIKALRPSHGPRTAGGGTGKAPPGHPADAQFGEEAVLRQVTRRDLSDIPKHRATGQDLAQGSPRQHLEVFGGHLLMVICRKLETIRQVTRIIGINALVDHR
jgi:hypothetical protein